MLNREIADGEGKTQEDVVRIFVHLRICIDTPSRIHRIAL